jgi:elongation factor P
MIPATQLKVGMTIKFNGQLCRITHVMHVTPGNWRGMVQTKMKNLETGSNAEFRFRAEDKVDRAVLEQHEMEYLYSSGSDHHFMNTETYEQISLDDEVLGESVPYLTPNIRIAIEFHEGRPVGIELPQTVDLRVVETDPPLKNATVSGGPKPAKLETGLVVNVPKFIEAGEVIRINTTDGTYQERAK